MSCSSEKTLEQDAQLRLVGNAIILDTPEPIDVAPLKMQLIQKPASGIMSFFKKSKVVLDTALTNRSCEILKSAMANEGYLDNTVDYDVIAKGRNATVFYRITPRQRYSIRHINSTIDDLVIDSLLLSNGILDRFMDGTAFRDRIFSVNALQDERKRITSWLNNNGYMLFNKENITFDVDSSQRAALVDIHMRLGLYKSRSADSVRNHPRYFIRSVKYQTPPAAAPSPATATVSATTPAPVPEASASGSNAPVSPLSPLSAERVLRPHTLEINSFLQAGKPYSAEDMQLTYNKFSRLKAIRATNISFQPTSAPDTLDAIVQLTPRKKHAIMVQPEGTNTAGDLGAAMSMTYENRNVFRGSEVFSLQARVAFEAISELDGYSNKNYEEYGVEAKLTFPEFIIPGLSDNFQRRHNATTDLLVGYNMQNRPEFHRRVFNGTWRYKWTSHSGNVGYTFDLLDLNYISMPWISDTFKHDYLDSISNRNAILRYNYEDLFLMKMGFGIKKTTDTYSLRANVETAGNLLNLAAQLFTFPKNDDGQYKVARVAFAQYVKLDFDYTRLLKLDYRNTLALHGRFGLAVPYGNSNILQFEKRYFAGGANSVRGWSVRNLGPGGYISKDGRIDFLNQTGDVKLDLNAELRSHLFWKFQGALFIDAGNIWTLRNYNDQPNGQFLFQNVLKQMAVAYGCGLRLNFDYFILRLDFGMKAINPAYTTSKEHYPITNHKLSRDYALHFAVGLPF